MLFYLTGDIQTGKTRWLQRLVDEFERGGVPVSGVLAPGVWRETPDGPQEREKLGIDNLLLPHHELISFGRRADLARAEGLLNEESQSAKAGLGWIFPDAALERVNAHLAEVGRSARQPGLLVIDELGQLELLRGGGLVEAVSLLARGETRAFPHAIVIVREWLLEPAHDLLDAAWEGCAEDVLPDEGTFCRLLGLYGLHREAD